MIDAKSVGERIASARKSKGMTQERFSEILGIRRDKLAKWEAGIANVKIQDIIIIAQKLNISSDYLLGLRNTMSLDEDKNIQAISEYTGLDKYALNRLHNNRTNENLRSIASDFIGNDSFWNIIEECNEIKSTDKCFIGDYYNEYFITDKIVIFICRQLSICQDVLLEYLKSKDGASSIDAHRNINLHVDGLRSDIHSNLEQFIKLYDLRKTYRYTFTSKDICRLLGISSEKLEEMQNKSK